jgi:GMP synthase-like glutamine amidotransferase
MRIHVLQHSAINTLGTIEDYAETKNYQVESTRFYEIDESPKHYSFDLLIIMGGPMGTYDYEENPWLRNEKEFIKQAIESGKPVLGICLGAQILADILGARVYENKFMEIGFPLRTSKLEKEPNFRRGSQEEITVFHWHSQTFDLPAGSVHLFESEGCKNQGFLYGGRVVALQFHPEVNEERIESLIERFGDKMADGPFVQKKEKMFGQEKYLAGTKELLFTILDKFEEMI